MRREFTRAVKVAVIKRATVGLVVVCEKCGLPAIKWQIDHVIADSCGGEPILENAELICEACYRVKNPQDTKRAAKIKRIEAKHLGVRPEPTIRNRGFDKKPKPEKLPMPKSIPMYVKD